MPALSIADAFSPDGLAALAKVIAIDLTLAGDNVVVLGTLAAGLPGDARKRVLAVGVGIALVFLIAFAWFATELLDIIGLLFAGGLLLVWVAWRLWRELRASKRHRTQPAPIATGGIGRAIFQVAVADLSMSLDNVLAVAGAARAHPTVLVFGLGLSVTLMAVAANLIARVIARHGWIAYIGLAVILWVAGSMLWDGWHDPRIGLGLLFRRS